MFTFPKRNVYVSKKESQRFSLNQQLLFRRQTNASREIQNFYKRCGFLDKSGKLLKFDQFVPFGLGKRVCMGESLAKNELFLFFVRMLQKVSFEQTVNKPDVNNKIYGITTLPKPFEVKVVAK